MEILMPNKTIIQFKVKKIYDIDDNELDAARHPLQIIKINLSVFIQKNSMVRKVLN
ncbi:MAG: U32 family peptidase C-terminal domain-containing protein [Bacillota bacterium]